MNNNILDFVHNLTLQELDKIFCGYSDYEHILKNKIVAKTEEEKRRALINYFQYFILEKDSDDERYQKLIKVIVERNKEKLSYLLQDQYFEEPLMHMLNQDTKHYNLK